LMAVNFIKGVQGDGEYLRAAACAKHFAVHSGPEYYRHGFDARVGMKDLNETYLPAFEHTVKAGVAGVMGAYNRTNGEPCCAHSYLMDEVLFGKWGFEGYFTSDCGAVLDIFEGHGCAGSLAEAAALAVRHGCHLNCGQAYAALTEAFDLGMVSEKEIRDAAVRLFTIRAALGEFEEERPYSSVPYSAVNCEKHRELNLRAAEECLVLLKNEGDFLPFGGKYKKIAVIGPVADSTVMLEGNYNGASPEYVTPAEGVRRVFCDSEITVSPGCKMYEYDPVWGSANYYADAMAAAEEADAVVLCLGLDREVEGEEMGIDCPDFFHGDRTGFGLPETQIELARRVCEVSENVAVLVFCGGPVDLGEDVNGKIKALVHCWYPGALGGLAAARLLRGDFSPSGRLPVTFPKKDAELPPIEDYSMSGRTYRYMSPEKMLYPFGFGLSYTRFEYLGLSAEEDGGENLTVSVGVKNAGGRAGLEKVMIFAEIKDSRTETPFRQLCGVALLYLEPGETGTATVTVEKYWLRAVLPDGSRAAPDLGVKLTASGGAPNENSPSVML
ncbi:MAG: glycoside hydrolase family 3 C-terminal domain-containing protein, partial [Clostridia bacterium]|nr:glycoside hydrolase family 3 C-terminal domain-containing protein [Clostridia bacterium]